MYKSNFQTWGYESMRNCTKYVEMMVFLGGWYESDCVGGGRGGAEKVQGESVGWWSEGERGVGRNENSVGNQYPRHFVSSSAPFSALLLSPCVQIYINKMLMSKCRSFFQFISL